MEKWLHRLALIIKLFEVIPQGRAIITWQDKSVTKVEKLETDATIK